MLSLFPLIERIVDCDCDWKHELNDSSWIISHVRWKVTLFLLIHKDCVSGHWFCLFWCDSDSSVVIWEKWCEFKMWAFCPPYSSIVCWISGHALCWCSHIPAVQYWFDIIEVNHNLVSWRAKGCKRFPSDVEPYLYPRLHGHVTPNASCVTVNNPAFVKPSQIEAINPLWIDFLL